MPHSSAGGLFCLEFWASRGTISLCILIENLLALGGNDEAWICREDPYGFRHLYITLSELHRLAHEILKLFITLFGIKLGSCKNSLGATQLFPQTLQHFPPRRYHLSQFLL